MSCLNIEKLDRLVSGALPQAELESALKHVSSCDSCRIRASEVESNEAMARQLVRAETQFDKFEVPTVADPPGYKLTRMLHRGGQAVVFEAVQDGTGRRVAIKVLSSPKHDQRAERRFEREIDLVGNLRHEGIVRLLDAQALDGRRYLVMELIDGSHLKSIWSDGSPAPFRESLPLFTKICRAVHYAHQRGIIHRDLKPGNILVDADLAPHILDFGIAKVTESPRNAAAVTRTGEFAGTLLYAAPEQVLGTPDAIDVRTDIYALGVILHEMLAGVHPRRDATHVAGLVNDLVTREPKGPSADRTGLDPDLDVIVRRAMALDPDRRYASAEALARDVERFLNGEPLEARDPTPWYVLKKFVRRHRIGVAVAATVFIALAASTAAAVFFGQKADRQAHTANAAVTQLSKTVEEMYGLTDAAEISRLIDMVPTLLPVTHLVIRPHEKWLHDADRVLARAPGYERALRELRKRALPQLNVHRRTDDPFYWHFMRAARRELEALEDLDELDTRQARRLKRLEEWIHEFETTFVPLQAWRYESEADKALDHRLDRIVTGVAKLRKRYAHMKRRLEQARTYTERCLRGAAAEKWKECIAAVRTSPKYQGLELKPQAGLVPLMENPKSGLWEFWHVQSGTRPEWNEAQSAWNLTILSGVVLVLLPGGRFDMGARLAKEGESPDAPNVDPIAYRSFYSVQSVLLEPFFISKYEMTPGHRGRVMSFDSVEEMIRRTRRSMPWGLTRIRPETRITYLDALRVCERLGLFLPSEAQWEYACRAGTATMWFTGNDPARLASFARFATPGTTVREGTFAERILSINALRPNPFGIHNMLGNVAEWCIDPNLRGRFDLAPGTGARMSSPDMSLASIEFTSQRHQIVRGGSCADALGTVTAATRDDHSPETRSSFIGYRAVRQLDWIPLPEDR